PSTSPFSTAKEMPSTARIGPKAFTRLSILIIGNELEFGVRAVIISNQSASRIITALTPNSEARDSRTSSRSKTMQLLGKLFATAILALAAGVAGAQAKYPAKPIHIFVPFAPGGGSDFIARFTAQRLTDALGSELIALAKQKPGTINFASAGQGSITHMVAELFQSMAAIKMNHVPYKGTGPALTDTISGQTDIFFSSTATALPHVKSGRLRAIAVTSAKRLPAEPEVPTIAESGVPGFDVILWHGLIAPKGVPAPIVERINAEV